MAFGVATVKAAAKFPAAKPGFKPGTTQIVNGESAPIVLGPGTPTAVGQPQKAPAVAAAVNVNASPAAAAPASPPADGTLDATALGQIANNQFATNQKIAGLNQTGAYATTDLQKALQAITQQAPLDNEKALESFNQAGLLYSGHLGQALGQLGQSAADRSAALQTTFARDQASRQSQISDLGQAEQIYDQNASAASAARRAALAAADTSLGTALPAPTVAASPTQALAQAIAATPSTTQIVNGESAPIVLGPGTPTAVGGLGSGQNILAPSNPVVQTIADPAKGGVIHVHADGSRVFVKGGKA
jgi:hypothetical protein